MVFKGQHPPKLRGVQLVSKLFSNSYANLSELLSNVHQCVDEGNSVMVAVKRKVSLIGMLLFAVNFILSRCYHSFQVRVSSRLLFRSGLIEISDSWNV